MKRHAEVNTKQSPQLITVNSGYINFYLTFVLNCKYLSTLSNTKSECGHTIIL